MLAPAPSLIVFDLDYTLWSCWVECYSPPFRRSRRCRDVATDAHGASVRLYPTVLDSLDALRARGIKLACASRTPTPDRARQLVRTFGLDEYFGALQAVYPGDKQRHVRELAERAGCAPPYHDVLFFDDERRNVKSVSERLGVMSVLVDEREGASKCVVERALQQYAEAGKQR